MGGYSSEVNISLKSGEIVYDNISKEIYNTFKIHILKDKWVLVEDDNSEYEINKHDFSCEINHQKIEFDIVFNAIHGNPGEDGVILAYFDLIGVKHTSAPFYQMALTFNKRDCICVLKQYGIKTANSFLLNKGDDICVDKIVEKVGLPCFVKPNRAGSSFGISKVRSKNELNPAINKAFEECNEILIEEFLDGTEVTVGVIDYKGKTTVLPMTEIVTDNDFFDFEAKYFGESQEITPARIPESTRKKIEIVAKYIYDKLNMNGFTRSEFILIDDEPYFLEMNTVPGLTAESIIPQQAEKAGISLQELFHNAIEMVLNK